MHLFTSSSSDMKKDLVKKIAISIFVVILTIPTVLWTCMGVLGMREEQASFAELGENRAAKQLTDVKISNLTEQLEEYYNDRVPFRSSIILKYRKVNSKMEYYYQNHIQPKFVEVMGETAKMENISISSDLDIDSMYGDNIEATSDGTQAADNTEMTPEEMEAAGIHQYKVIDIIKASYTTYGYTLERCSNCGRFRKIDFSEKLIDETYLPPKEGEGRVIQGRFNWLYYAGDNSIAYYTGSNILSEEEMAEWTALMQNLQNACDEKGIKLGFMIMPNKNQVYPEYMPNYTVKTSKKREDVFLEYVKSHTNINFVYPIEELKAEKRYYETYFPYDTHWTQAGAFIGTMAMYKEMGFETTNLNDLEVLPTEFTQKGLIDTGSLDEAMYQDDIDYVIVYKPEIQVTWFEGEKSFVMPTNVYRATSNNPNNEKLVMIGDSFRLAMIPYLSQDYSEICVAHRNALDEVADDLKDPDVLIVASVERFDKYMFEVLPRITEYVKAR